jgi:hypothetical protein
VEGVILGIATIVISVAGALLGLIVVRRRVPLHVLKEQHEVAGVSFAVIGGFYGVLLAFVLVTSSERLERARANTELEANALGELYRQAAGIPEPQRGALRATIVAYARSVMDFEWPAMEKDALSPHTQQLYADIWTAVLGVPAEDPKSVALFQCMLEKLDDFGEARRYRVLYMDTGLPPAIWSFLVAFGVITVAFTYFFGMPRLLSQAIITVVLTTTIAFTLFIIWEMQTPFSGIVHVSDHAFHVVLNFMQTEQGS